MIARTGALHPFCRRAGQPFLHGLRVFGNTHSYARVVHAEYEDATLRIREAADRPADLAWLKRAFELGGAVLAVVDAGLDFRPIPSGPG